MSNIYRAGVALCTAAWNAVAEFVIWHVALYHLALYHLVSGRQACGWACADRGHGR